MKIIFTLVVFCFFNVLLKAQPGALDSSYGTNGKISFKFSVNSRSSSVTNIVIQKDNKIVEAGTSYDQRSGIETFTVYRLMPNGSIDLKFGDHGRAIIPFHVDYAEPYCLAIQPDGKILIAGYGFKGYKSTKYYGLITRLNKNGRADSSFGDDGKVYSSSSVLSFYTILVQPDNKIVTSGSGTLYSHFVIRYLSNGVVDSTFGKNGFSIYDNAFLSCSSIQSDGKIIFAGNVKTKLNTQALLIRYLQNGKLDSSFGVNGSIITGTDFYGDEFSDIAIQSNNKIVVIEQFQIEILNGSSAVLRFLPEGDLDKNFGKQGVDSIFSAVNNINLGTVLLQKDGRIIIAGSTNAVNTDSADFLVMRLQKNGDIDSSFGINGKAITDFGASERIWSAVLQTDDKLVACGESIDNIKGFFAVDFARYWLEDHSDFKTIFTLVNNHLINSSPYYCPNLVHDRLYF